MWHQKKTLNTKICCGSVALYKNPYMTKYKVQNNIQAQEFCENAVSIPLLTKLLQLLKRRQRVNKAAINWSANQFDVCRK